MLKGITILLFEKEQVGVDGFGNPILEETPVPIENVLIAPAQDDPGGIATSTDFQGKVERYIMAIPKGDTHDWKDKHVEFFGRRWKTVGVPKEGIEDLIPLAWNKKVSVERFE